MLKQLGAAPERAGRSATSLVTVAVASDGALTYRLDRARLRAARARERDVQLLLDQLVPTFPPQPPPRIRVPRPL
ncbi:MAG: hypothetical protein HY302_13315 [Opitutae bacterium]|nr:hypothetical protein [Opitutae bacterium]